MATPIEINSADPFTVSKASEVSAVPFTVARILTPLVAVDKAPGLNATLATPSALVVVEPGSIDPLLPSVIAVKFTIAPETGFPLASRTVADKVLAELVEVVVFGNTELGLACKTTVAGVTAIKLADSVVRAVPCCAEILTGPAVGDEIVVVANPFASVVAEDEVSVPRVVLNVTTRPATPTPLLKYCTVTGVETPTAILVSTAGEVKAKFCALMVMLAAPVVPRPVAVRVSVPAFVGV